MQRVSFAANFKFATIVCHNFMEEDFFDLGVVADLVCLEFYEVINRSGGFIDLSLIL